LGESTLVQSIYWL